MQEYLGFSPRTTPTPPSERDIFTRDREGELIHPKDKGFEELLEVIRRTHRLTHRLNTQDLSDEEVRQIFSEIIGVEVDSSAWILPPFYTDFGRNIRIGKIFFMNQGCTFMDRGGISIGDDVFIAPRVWIGINATICPGVSIGDNSIM